MVVDDEDLIADSVAAILNRNGCCATATYSAKAAIQCAELECPDIIVSDVIMPRIQRRAIGQSDSSALSRRESFVVLR
jgi:CheY-like chemotaxis protein